MALFHSNKSNHSTDSVTIKTKGLSSLGNFAGLPSAFKSAPRGALNKDDIVNKIDGLKRWSVRQLQEAANIIAQLNRYNIKPEKRVEIVRAILGLVYPAMARHYQVYHSQVMSLPEGNEQREILLAAIEIAEQSGMAYKHLFKEIYSAKSSGYKRQREKIIETGIRILELVRLEQRLRALRHQKLPPSQWQDLNRTFFSLYIHDDADAYIKLLGSIGTWVKQNKKEKEQKHQAPSASAKKLFLSIQLFGLLDAPSWSTRLFHIPDAYLEIIDNAIQIFPDSGVELEPGWLITHVDNKAPPLFQREARLPEPRVLIEYSNLYNRLVIDYEELAKMKFIGRFDASKLSRPLLDLESMERFPVLETMLFGLRPRERKQKRHAAFGHENLKLYFSFKDAYRLLVDLASPDVKRVSDSRAFIDLLAGYSAGVTDELSENNRSRWEIVNFSTGGLLVLTRETSYTNPIQIGQIIAFIPNQDVKRPLIGYVSRIHRPSEQQVEVAIVRLSNHAEAAIVQDNQEMKGSTGRGVLIFQSLDGKWCLIARHEYDFVSGTPLRLVRENNQIIPARLGNVMLTNKEFVVFELSAPGL